MNGATVAILGMLSASAGLLRLIDLPGGGSGIFFLVVLAGAAFGPRFGLLLGLCSMAVSAIVTGGIGPVAAVPDARARVDGRQAPGFVGLWHRAPGAARRGRRCSPRTAGSGASCTGRS